MKVQLKKALKCLPIFEELKNKKLPIRVAYKLSRLAKEIRTHEEFYKEQISLIITENAMFDENGQLVLAEDGQSFCVTPGKEKACYLQISELENLEIELPNLYFLLEELEDLKFTLAEIEILFPFLQE